MPDIYEFATWPLVVGLLLLSLGANELGFRLGRRYHHTEPESARAVSNTLKASIFGLSAFLLGFAFSMTSSRHELRQRLVLNEANAINTCYLRAGLLEDADRDRIRDTLRRYTTARLEYFDRGLDPGGRRQRFGQEMDRLLVELWAHVESANKKNREVVLTSQIIPAANEVIDLSTTRAWTIRNHVPTPVLMLLTVCVLVSCLIAGHSSGQTGNRHIGLWTALNVLFSLVLFVVLDFDRPRRGLIRVDHQPLIELKASFDAPTGRS